METIGQDLAKQRTGGLLTVDRDRISLFHEVASPLICAMTAAGADVAGIGDGARVALPGLEDIVYGGRGHLGYQAAIAIYSIVDGMAPAPVRYSNADFIDVCKRCPWRSRY